MATWATRAIQPAYYNEANRYLAYPPADSEDFEVGAAVVMASGEISECGADPASILGFAVAGVTDYDWKDDTFGDVDAAIPVARADQVFRGTLKGTYAASDVGTEYGLVDESGTWVVDRSETGATRVVIIGVDDDVEAGDVNPPVLFTVLAANQQVVT